MPVSAVGLIISAPATAQISCPAPTSADTCTIEANQGGDGAQVRVEYSGRAGSNGYAGRYTVQNNGAALGPGTPNIMVQLKGGDGTESNPDGATAGRVIINTDGQLNAVGSNSVPYKAWNPGAWDDEGVQFGIYGASAGGNGAHAENTVIGGGSGGRGGNGEQVSITHQGKVQLTSSSGGAVIYGGTVGGLGGNQDNAPTGNQKGGNGGDSNTVDITNKGDVVFNSNGVQQYAWGIAAETIGRQGGRNNGDGGTAGSANSLNPTIITNEGNVQVIAEGSNLEQGVRGLSLYSQGGNGTDSNDGDDNGGAGGGLYSSSIVQGGTVDVRSQSVSTANTLAELSGGIVLIAQGGDGGGGPNIFSNFTGVKGGDGGSAGYPGANPRPQILTSVNLADGSSVSTQGSYLPGVNVLNRGGAGGLGHGDSNGGHGGDGTPVKVTMTGSAAIETTGLESHGVIARSYGGAGGGVRVNSGFIDFTPEIAGNGGRGGAVSILTGEDGKSGGSITTSGDGATGILAQTMGGIGGSTTDSFQFVSNPGTSGGKGGESGSVDISSRTRITTRGVASHGVVGQAIGGAGGMAGASSGITALGGEGGTGVSGGTVTIGQRADITTSGSRAMGVLAQAIGGGGGDGGAGSGMAVIGGSGGAGGDGGTATTTLSGSALGTAGDHAHGIVSQSIGGGGGTGGAASAYSAGAGFSMAIAIGGSGGVGGKGGSASVNVDDASIATGSDTAFQDDAHGIVVQSIGGGGGSGGDSVAKSLAVAVPVGETSFAVAVSFAMGGDAGDGATGGTASANLTRAQLDTYGGNSQGVLVQSVGGGGGNGGSASATSTVVGTGESIGGTLQSALGGSGGTGGHGGQATLDMVGSRITTRGDASNAVMLQSIGAGGGSGGIGSATGRSAQTAANVSITTSLGGTGGAGGSGGTVALSVDPSSAITTHGSGARAVLVQSVGGGGGASQGGQFGLDLSGSTEDQSIDAHASFSIGRGGSAGGNGGALLLNSDGNITTYGADADGLLAQSIGGSGGLGGSVGGEDASTVSLPSLDDGSTRYKLDVYVGGNGGAGGAGGQIGSLEAPASLGASTRTQGDYADAVVLQSIGGGGGAGGASTVSSSISEAEVTLAVGGRGGSGGRGGAITTFLNGNGSNAFNTEGYGAMGIVMQSIGGGGGQAGSGSPRARGRLSAGGIGNYNQVGGDITVVDRSWAAIDTKGDSAHGMVLQSIGGGGGIAIAGSRRTAQNPGRLRFDLAAGSADGGGDGGHIDVQAGLNLTTTGDRAIGVIAQSIGDGGGIVSVGDASGVGTIELGSRRARQYISVGKDVRLSLTNKIATLGAGAHGIVAQSIGGGGGIVGDTAQPIQFGPDGFRPSSVGGYGGTGGALSVSFDGNLSTKGANAHGIVAQSIGGGGGLAGGPQGGFAGSIGYGGEARAVSVMQAGTLQASGDGSVGIFAQSDAQDASQTGAVNVTINGAVQGGSGDGSGVWVASGRDNHVTINPGASLSALSGVALRYDAKNSTSSTLAMTLDNDGSLQGSVVCNAGAGVCDVINREGAVASDARVYQANFKNEGLVVVGGPGRFDDLAVSGDLDLSESSMLRVHADFDKLNTSHLRVQGNASLAGTVQIVPDALLPQRDVAVITADGGTRGQLKAVGGPVVQYETRQIGDRTLVRATSADFAAGDMKLEGDENRVASHLQQAWDRGGSASLAPLFAQLDLASRLGGGTYRDTVANLTPGVNAAPALQSAASLGQFTNTMMSCPTFTGVDAMTGERNCFWGQAGGRWARQDAGGGVPGFDADTYTYQFGGQREISPGWFLGGSVAYESSRLRGSDGRGRGDGDSGYVGVVLKRESGPWVFSAGLGGGYGSYSMERRIGIAGYQEMLDSGPDVYGFNARLRAARTFAYDNVYIKPYVDLDATYTRMPGYDESGSNPLALSVDGSDQFLLGVSPMIEVGGRADLRNGMMLRPYVYGGVSLLSDDDWKTTARLRGAPAGTPGFDSALPFDDVVGKVGAGLQLTGKTGVDFRLQYDGQFSDNASSHGVTLKMVVPF